MLQSTKIQGTVQFIGASGDSISNPNPRIWDFNGAELQNVVLNSGGQFTNLTRTFFVEPNFAVAGPFFNTIQAAINAAANLGISEEKVVFVFPGNYDEFIKLEGLTNINVVGVGQPNLKVQEEEEKGKTIEIESSDKITFKNFNMYTDAGINGLSSVELVKINNSSDCLFDNIKIKISANAGPVDFNFFGLTTLYGPIFFENLNLNLELIDGIQANDTYLTFIKCNGTSSEGQVKITNSKFKLDFDKTGNSFETFVYPLYILTETETKYNFLINECEFEYLETNRVGGDITFELIKAARISVEGDKYNMVSFFNSFTNTDYHIDINSQNVLKDSDFKILN